MNYCVVDPANTLQQLHAPSHPSLGHNGHNDHNQHATSPPHVPPVLQAQESRPAPLPEDREVVLDPRDIESIPHPSGLSRKNLPEEMGLDKTKKGWAYYYRIRVRVPTQDLCLLTAYAPRLSFANTWAMHFGRTGAISQKARRTCCATK